MTTLFLSRCVVLLLLPISVLVASPSVHVITLDATINPATADFIHEAIQRAYEAKAECLVIKLNTPGGLLKSTRVIVSDVLSAPLCVVVFVAPSGSQSASAGTFITLAAHVAAMAPGTNIGAAHPVGLQGAEKDSIMNEKATNDAAAFIRSISEKRNRNVTWAEDAVRRSISITEAEALKLNVIDIVSPTVSGLLDSLDGRTVEINGKKHVLATKNVQVEEFQMDWKHTILDLLSDPNVPYIFFLLGIYGLMFELYNPGSILPGVVGVIAIIIALYSMHTMPINYAGLALILFGVVLFLLEIKITSYGLLSLGGIVALALGSIMLIDSDSSLEFLTISWGVIIPSVLLTAAFFFFAVGMGIRAQRLKPTTGVEGIIGETGQTITALDPDGSVRVHGEIWNATSEAENIPERTNVTVVAVNNLKLTVRKG
jgi:membrane-bound serine protease (ClpP class)